MTQTNRDRNIIVTVDVVLFALHDKRLHVVLTRRPREPYAGQLALPGGYVHQQEDIDSLAAAVRVLRTKTGIAPPYLEQLYSFADGARDPRGWSVSLGYFALVDESVLRAAQSVEPGFGFELFDVSSVPRLSFDHNRIVDVALQRLRDKSAYSTLPCYLLPEQFTFAQVHETYEHVMGVALDKSAFRRKLTEMDVLEECKGQRVGGAHRPAQLFRVKTDLAHRLRLLDRPLAVPNPDKTATGLA
ncbi:MAG: NUDIX hydrolase [Rhodoferax sp.]|jgi:8-oxo-dGTP diphosphatase|uniref:NUDIX hydrolase n=1 Tax=Rhodoferax sp. TaxID=50421 RepID=UPI001B72B743|nr:NUDIX domain-containing protein [Rhodoferax sp.]MBK7051913.1 NUDIX hydrolase [Rhodoferax sp.]MBP8286670.1 NUDIX hydrolase [Rhodoferax sp.]MBP9735121.1 NUDIX hydrolase [Rhodoferax sp.]